MLCDWDDTFNLTPEQEKYYEDEYKKMRQMAYNEHDCYTCIHYIPDEPVWDFFQSCPTCKITGRAAIKTCDMYESNGEEEID